MLSKRLFTAAQLVIKNKNACDIGTDHAYLPVYLVENNICNSVMACDVNEKPLEIAEKTVNSKKLQNKIIVRLSDGIKNVDENYYDNIIICGMGGELIVKILSEFDFKNNRNINYVLNPMTKSEVLREWLCENGFLIKKEVPVFDEGHYYTVIKAEFIGETIKPDEVFKKIGKAYETINEDTIGYLENEIRKLKKIAFEMQNSKSINTIKINDCLTLSKKIEKILDGVKKEWQQ